MNRDTLQLVHSTEPPGTELTVYDEWSAQLLGERFRFQVIGSSHCISAPDAGFYELASCDAPGSAGETIHLDRDGTDRSLAYEADHVVCETIVDHRPLSAFPRDGSFDLAYRFGEDALTTITLVEDGYETYHTYPEYGLALYTRTRFDRLGTDRRRVDAGARE